jgi:hypothetical protein
MNAPLSALPLCHQTILEQLDLMLRARYPLIYIVGAEEEPMEAVLREVAGRSTLPRDLYLWDIVGGWADNGSLEVD